MNTVAVFFQPFFVRNGFSSFLYSVSIFPVLHRIRPVAAAIGKNLGPTSPCAPIYRDGNCNVIYINAPAKIMTKILNHTFLFSFMPLFTTFRLKPGNPCCCRGSPFTHVLVAARS